MWKVTVSAPARRNARARGGQLNNLLLAGFSITKAMLHCRQASMTLTLKLASTLETSAPSPCLFFLAMLQNLQGVPNQHTPMRPDLNHRSIVSRTAEFVQSHQSPLNSSIGAATRSPLSRQAPDSRAQPAKISMKALPFLSDDRRAVFFGGEGGGSTSGG